MSNKKNSTISTKPAIDPLQNWIDSESDQSSKEMASIQSDKLINKQVDLSDAPTAMLSARVPASLLKKLRIRAATDERTIQEIVTEMLREYLEQD